MRQQFILGQAGHQDVVERISDVIDAYLKEPATAAKFHELGAIPVGGKPEKLAKHLESEQARFGKLLSTMKGSVQ